jgi:hypothetical protein
MQPSHTQLRAALPRKDLLRSAKIQQLRRSRDSPARKKRTQFDEVHRDELGGWTAARAAARATLGEKHKVEHVEHGALDKVNEPSSAPRSNVKSASMAARFWKQYEYEEPSSPGCNTTMTELMEDFEEVESQVVERVEKNPIEMEIDVAQIGNVIQNWQRTKSATNMAQNKGTSDCLNLPENVAAAKFSRKEQEWSAIEAFQSTSRFRGRRLKRFFGVWTSLYKAVTYHRLQTLSSCFSKLYVYYQARIRKAHTRALCDAHYTSVSTSRCLHRWRQMWEDAKLANAANEVAATFDFNRRGRMVFDWWLQRTRHSRSIKTAAAHWERRSCAHVLQSWSFRTRERLVHQQKCEDAEYYFRLNLGLKCMSGWRRFVRLSREERTQQRTSSKRFVFGAWEQFVCERHSRRAQFAFALNSMERCLLRRCLHEWWRSSSEDALLAIADDYWVHQRAAFAVRALRVHAIRAVFEREVEARMQAGKLSRGVRRWAAWTQEQQLQRRADAYWSTRAATLALRTWSGWLVEKADRTQKQCAADRCWSQRAAARALEMWQAAVRRRKREWGEAVGWDKRKRSGIAFGCWRQYVNVQHRFEQRAADFRAAADIMVTYHVFEAWCARVSAPREWFQRRLVARMMRRWCLYLETRRCHHQALMLAHMHWSQRELGKAVQGWALHCQMRRRTQMVEAAVDQWAVMQQRKRCWVKWRAALAQRREAREAVVLAGVAEEQRLLKIHLLLWFYYCTRQKRCVRVGKN